VDLHPEPAVLQVNGFKPDRAASQGPDSEAIHASSNGNNSEVVEAKTEKQV